MALVVSAVDTNVAGNEPWTSEQSFILVLSFWTVSSSPLGNGAQQRKEDLFGLVMNEYERRCAIAGVQLKKTKRTPRALRLRWQAMQTLINRFIAMYLRARFVIKK